MWPFKREARTTQAELKGAEAMTVTAERSAKAAELRLARRVNQLLKKVQDAPLDLGLEQIGRDLRGER